MGLQEAPEPPSLPIHHQLTDIWKRLLRVEVSSIAESFFDLGGTPHVMQRMLEEVHCETGDGIDAGEFLRDPTIRGLTKRLLRDASTNSFFEPIQERKGRPPLYFFHGDILGGGYYTKRLAALLGDDLSFYVSAPIELGEDELPEVEELAARKRQALQRWQAHGPYLLGGFCVGAVIAYEVARQLKAQGETVDAVLLIEPEIGDVFTRSYLRLVDSLIARCRRGSEKVDAFMWGLKKIERLRHVWCSPWTEKKAFAVRNSKKLLFRKHRAGDAEVAPKEAFEANTKREWLLSAYHWVLTSYVPQPFEGPVTMLLTDDQFEVTPFILQQWQKVAPQLRVERIPGSHLGCITTHLDDLAKRIRAEINPSARLS